MDTKETTAYHAVLIAAAVIGTIIAYFIIAIIRQQRKHRLLYKAKIEAEITTLEKERTRVAADLHDELGPTLSAAKFKLGSIEGVTGEDEKMITDAILYIDTILQQVRHIANDLMPNTLLRNGPISAIEEFIDHMTGNSSLKISFHHTNIPGLPQSQAVHVYRIIQEIIHNTVKHANARELKIELYANKNKLIIATADDGKGFNYNTMHKENNGLGLSNLRSRTDILSGSIHVSSKPGKGTRFTIEIPLFS